MISDITIGHYLPGSSFTHKLDPRTKIIISILYVISLFCINKFYGYIFPIIFLFVVIKNAKIPFKFVVRGLKPIIFLIIITALFNVFMTRGTSDTLLLKFGMVKIYSEGVRLAVFMALRWILLIKGTTLLTYTTSPIQLTDGIEKLLRFIGKELAHELAMMMTIALRFIPTLLDETDKIMKAQMSRGADFESKNLVSRAKNLVPLLVPLFVSAFRRAEELAMAMEARCYRGGYNRTKMRQSIITKSDYIAGCILIIYLVIIIITRFI